ncbi:hypothetical protein MOF35_16185, partial [Bacillus haynesii]
LEDTGISEPADQKELSKEKNKRPA